MNKKLGRKCAFSILPLFLSSPHALISSCRNTLLFLRCSCDTSGMSANWEPPHVASNTHTHTHTHTHTQHHQSSLTLNFSVPSAAEEDWVRLHHCGESSSPPFEGQIKTRRRTEAQRWAMSARPSTLVMVCRLCWREKGRWCLCTLCNAVCCVLEAVSLVGAVSGQGVAYWSGL